MSTRGPDGYEQAVQRVLALRPQAKIDDLQRGVDGLTRQVEDLRSRVRQREQDAADLRLILSRTADDSTRIAVTHELVIVELEKQREAGQCEQTQRKLDEARLRVGRWRAIWKLDR